MSAWYTAIRSRWRILLIDTLSKRNGIGTASLLHGAVTLATSMVPSSIKPDSCMNSDCWVSALWQACSGLAQDIIILGNGEKNSASDQYAIRITLAVASSPLSKVFDSSCLISCQILMHVYTGIWEYSSRVARASCNPCTRENVSPGTATGARCTHLRLVFNRCSSVTGL